MKKIHRFITSYEVINNEIVIQDRELVHQWKNVLKFKTGEILTLANVDTGEALCTITDLSKSGAILSVAEINKNSRETNKKVVLYLAILKRENFELVIQKATEIGISKIVPIITEHTVKTGLKYDRLEKIALEAAELCGRNSVPEICEAMKYKDALMDCKDTESQIIFDISGEDFNSKISKFKNNNSISLFIGPEGGFTESEIALAIENNLETASLGPLMLRGETAAIVALYMAIN